MRPTPRTCASSSLVMILSLAGVSGATAASAAEAVDPGTLTTWDRFFEAAAGLRAAGVKTPIQLAASWTVGQLFESIMVSLGIATYEDWVNGKIRSAADPRLTLALGLLKRYSGSREGQDAFNVQKGSIPACIDATVDRYDGYQRSAIAAFKQSVIYPTFGGAMPGVYVRSLEATLDAFVDHGDVRRAATEVGAAALSSERSFTRVWSLD